MLIASLSLRIILIGVLIGFMLGIIYGYVLASVGLVPGIYTQWFVMYVPTGFWVAANASDAKLLNAGLTLLLLFSVSMVTDFLFNFTGLNLTYEIVQLIVGAFSFLIAYSIYELFLGQED